MCVPKKPSDMVAGWTNNRNNDQQAQMMGLLERVLQISEVHRSRIEHAVQLVRTCCEHYFKFVELIMRLQSRMRLLQKYEVQRRRRKIRKRIKKLSAKKSNRGAAGNRRTKWLLVRKLVKW